MKDAIKAKSRLLLCHIMFVGVGAVKRRSFCSLIRSAQDDVCFIQESKLLNFSKFKVKALWDNKEVE